MRMLRPRSTAVLFLFAAITLAADTVQVQQGSLIGTAGKDPSIKVYKGIPFAAPPVGDARWKSPKAPASWEGVRSAGEFSKTCQQTPYPAGSVYYQPPQPMSEDCLYLNVWTAAKSSKDKRPVMVWIHGGGLTRGSGSTPVYDGEEFAKKGVVLVSINYRLGIFGFFAHPELTKESDRNASGNYGLMDQIEALEWVRKNIQAFGGDPKRVTIFGESAGSWSVNFLVASPLAKGLFQRAIGESGGAFAPMKQLAEAEQAGLKTAAGDSLAALRAKPAEELLKISQTSASSPNVDGWLLPRDVYSTFALGKQNDVPVIVGSNANEGTTLSPWPETGTAQEFTEQSRKRFGDRTEAFLKLYPASTAEEAKKSHYDSFRDFSFGWQMRTWARLQTKTGKSKAYLYYFSHVPPGPYRSRIGAYHAAEIAYVFQNLSTRNAPTDSDRKIADLMSSYWVNFATTGDPNGKNLPAWPAYQQKTDQALEFSDNAAVTSDLNKPALDFLDSYFDKLRAGN